MRKTSCWLCGVKLEEHMLEESNHEKLCPECSMDAEDWGIEDDDLGDLFG